MERYRRGPTPNQGIGLVCEDGYVIGSDNKLITPRDDPFYRFYTLYFVVFKRECPLNHKALKEVLRGGIPDNENVQRMAAAVGSY